MKYFVEKGANIEAADDWVGDIVSIIILPEKQGVDGLVKIIPF